MCPPRLIHARSSHVPVQAPRQPGFEHMSSVLADQTCAVRRPRQSATAAHDQKYDYAIY
jgi:hypothetical protein